MVDKFVDQKYTWADFIHEFLVVCPRCSSCARVIPLPGGEAELNSPRRLTCTSCGMVKDLQPKGITLGNIGDPVDSYFQLPLWLKTQHGEESLWFYNLKHLEYIKSYIAASIRTRNLDSPGCLNCSIVSRLPMWMKKGSNRKRVLSRIKELKDSIDV